MLEYSKARTDKKHIKKSLQEMKSALQKTLGTASAAAKFHRLEEWKPEINARDPKDVSASTAARNRVTFFIKARIRSILFKMESFLKWSHFFLAEFVLNL